MNNIKPPSYIKFSKYLDRNYLLIWREQQSTAIIGAQASSLLRVTSVVEHTTNITTLKNWHQVENDNFIVYVPTMYGCVKLHAASCAYT